MKIMKLSDDEVKVVMEYREKIRVDEYRAKVAEQRRTCDHEWKYDFVNYKTTYYKCPKCGLTCTDSYLLKEYQESQIQETF